jgi:hypothetical protein
LRVLILILTIGIIFSGCVEENNATQSNESAYQGSVNAALGNISSTNLSHEEENFPEIEVTSFSSIYMHDNTERVYEYIFCWDNVPGKESQSLISYLKNDLNIDWVDNAQIVKTNDNETIRVFTPENSLELTLEDNKSQILTTIGSDSYHDSKKIKNENGKICVYKFYDFKPRSNITENCYAVYNLSITNNGSNNLYFRLNDLHVRDGNYIFNTTTIEPEKYSCNNEVLSNLETETKIEDITLFPGQTISGSVIFQVNSLYNESFILIYNETPISSASFEKSIKALRTVEYYDYSAVFGIPPYIDFYERSSFEPDLKEYPYIWPNWVNRSVFEFFNKTDSEEMLIPSPYSTDIPYTETVYALKVIPERNITSIIEGDTTPARRDNYFIVVDDTGEELINTSVIDKISTIAILKNQTYELHSGENMDIPQMNFSGVTIVKISYFNDYGWPLAKRIPVIDQDLILNDKMDIVVARCHCNNFIS